MSNLTIDDIHRIRKEHAISTRNMTFIEFKTSLYKEIKPLLEMLISLKTEKKKAITSYAEVESTVF